MTNFALVLQLLLTYVNTGPKRLLLFYLNMSGFMELLMINGLLNKSQSQMSIPKMYVLISTDT